MFCHGPFSLASDCALHNTTRLCSAERHHSLLHTSPNRSVLPPSRRVDLPVASFLPLADLYKKRYAMDGPAVPAVPDDCAGSVRIRGLKAFAAAVSAEPFAPVPADHQYHDGDGLMLLPSAGSSYRENRSEYSEASTGSGSHLMMSHDSARAFELALRPSGPSSQHSGRAPPGMGSGSVGPGGERATRSLSGPGPMGAGGGAGGGYFGSGSSLGAGSEGGEGWRASKGSGPGGCVFRFSSREKKE